MKTCTEKNRVWRVSWASSRVECIGRQAMGRTNEGLEDDEGVRRRTRKMSLRWEEYRILCLKTRAAVNFYNNIIYGRLTNYCRTPAIEYNIRDRENRKKKSTGGGHYPEAKPICLAAEALENGRAWYCVSRYPSHVLNYFSRTYLYFISFHGHSRRVYKTINSKRRKKSVRKKPPRLPMHIIYYILSARDV